jgi:hypothetical protein
VSQEQLSFEALQAKLDAAFPYKEPPAGKIERISLQVTLFGVALAVLAGLLLRDALIGKVLLLFGVALEVVGGVTYVVLLGLRSFSDLRFDDRSGAKECEQDFAAVHQVTTWLRTFPEDQLRSRLVFITHRLDGWRHGILLVMGSMEKLGMLPIFIALFLQFKDAKLTWPPEINPLGGSLTFAILLFYTLGLWASARKMQATRFERHLKIALDPDFKT